MNRHHGASALPAELVSLVFDLLSLEELLTASHVATYWRAVAHRHPIFWRDVTIASGSPSAFDFFHARLEAGSARSVIICFYVPPLEFNPSVQSAVFGTVARNLHRIDRLHIEIPISADKNMYAALNHPAPRLDTFDISVIDSLSDVLPVDLFACEAPRLRYVRISNTRLHADKIPRVFSRITQLNYCFEEALSFPTALFAHCPLLDTLIIYGKYCSLDVADDELRALPGDRLRYVDMTVFEGSSDLMRRLPCVSIPAITIAMYDKHSAPILLHHLTGPLDVRLDLEPDSRHLHLHYRSPETGMRRTFLGAPEQVALGLLPPAFVVDDVASRVKTLHATATCTCLLPAFHELASCTDIALSLVDGLMLDPPPRPLCVPKLEQLTLSSATPQSLSAGSLAAFLHAMFVAGPSAVQVRLDGIVLDGDATAIPQDRYAISSIVST